MYTVIRVSFEISTPDFLQVSVKATEESTISFRCMVQYRINPVPACGVPIVGEYKMTVGVGTVGRKGDIAFQSTALHTFMTTPCTHKIIDIQLQGVI